MTKSAVLDSKQRLPRHHRQGKTLYQLLTQSIVAPKKRNKTLRMTNRQKEKAEKDDIE